MPEKPTRKELEELFKIVKEIDLISQNLLVLREKDDSLVERISKMEEKLHKLYCKLNKTNKKTIDNSCSCCYRK